MILFYNPEIMLCKNKKGIIHDLNANSPQVKKWIKDDQQTPLTEAEIKAYAKSLKKVAPKKAPAKKPEGELSVTEQLRVDYKMAFDKDADPSWNAATLKKELKGVTQ